MSKLYQEGVTGCQLGLYGACTAREEQRTSSSAGTPLPPEAGAPTVEWQVEEEARKLTECGGRFLAEESSVASQRVGSALGERRGRPRTQGALPGDLVPLLSVLGCLILIKVLGCSLLRTIQSLQRSGASGAMCYYLSSLHILLSVVTSVKQRWLH